MNLYFAYKPSLRRTGWSVWLRFNSEIVPNPQFSNIESIEIACLRLEKQFSAKRLSEQYWKDETLLRKLGNTDLIAVCKAIKSIELKPAWYGLLTLDGAHSTLCIEDGSCTMALEWNSKCPGKWKGLNEFQAMLNDLRKRYT